MEATLGGSGGIPPDPSLETGRDEEKNLEKWRLRFLIIIEKGMTIEQVREEKKTRVFFQKIRSYEEGRSEGVKIGEVTLSTLYEGIIRLMMYIDNMTSWDRKAMRIERMKIVIQKAAGLAEKKGTENLTLPDQRSGEEYAKRVLGFLAAAGAKKRIDDEEEIARIKWSGSAVS